MKTIGRVVLKKSSEKKIVNFYPWVFKDDIQESEISYGSDGIVDILGSNGRFLAKGFYSNQSKNPVKIIAYSKELNIEQEIRKRILYSLEKRFRMIKNKQIDPNNFRVVFSEADFIPGLVIDKYGDTVAFQLRNRFTESIREVIIDSISKELGARKIYERSDNDSRKVDEKLSPRNIPVKGHIPERIIIQEGDVKFSFSPFKGQKTGFFLDQYPNRLLVRKLCKKGIKVLDVFSYVGGFGIHCAKSEANVVCIEKNETFANLIRENAEMNGLVSNLKVITGDAFEKIKEIDDKFDIIVLDPPTFVKSISESRKRLPLLIDLIKNSFELLQKDGKLIVFTCSYNLLKEHFVAAIRIAAMESKVRIAVEGELLQSPDHPWILQIPETLYLKGLVISRY